MKKLILVVLTASLFSASHAQKKFFQSVELVPYLYFDDIYYDHKEWPLLFRTPFKPFVQQVDSLNEFPDRGHFGNITGGRGIQIRLQKVLPVFKESSRSKLEWNTGVGHRTLKISSRTFYYGSYYYDTTKVYTDEMERFQLKQNFLDVYNSIVYNLNGKEWDWWNLFIGFGLQASFSMSGNLQDDYNSTTSQWNSSLRRWIDTQLPSLSKTVKAKSNRIYSYTVPVGWGVRFGKKILLKGSMEYFHATRSPIISDQKYSEGLMFQFALRYNL